MYQIEQIVVEGKQIFDMIFNYINTEESNKEIHAVEGDLFSMAMMLFRNLLTNVIARRSNELHNDHDSIKNDLNLPSHGSKTRKYTSIFGDIEIKRSYYWEKGREGVFPLDQELNLPESNYSYLLQKWVQSGVADTPYNQATKGLTELLGLPLPSSTQQIIAKNVSSSFSEYYEQKTNLDDFEGSMLIASADCKGIAMVPSERPDKPKEKLPKIRRGKGDKKKGLRKDATVVSDFSINPEPRRADEVLNGLMSVNGEKSLKEDYASTGKDKQNNDRKPINKHVSASMKGKVKAIQELVTRLEKRDPSQSKPIFVLIDGEKSLKDRIEEEFKKLGWEHRVEGYCLDIVHALEYLWDASTALYGEGDFKRIDWVHHKTLNLLDGHVSRVINSICRQLNEKDSKLKPGQKTTLRAVIRYFENHKDMMQYDKYLAKGLPIATGVIEGACSSLVKDRTDRSGMKWTKNGVQAVLCLRALKQNGDWEEYWNYYIEQERARLYGEPAKLAA
jgi:hypothetical protein